MRWRRAATQSHQAVDQYVCTCKRADGAYIGVTEASKLVKDVRQWSVTEPNIHYIRLMMSTALYARMKRNQRITTAQLVEVG